MRRATDVSLDTGSVERAKELGINVSRACEEDLAAQVRDQRRRWQEENCEAIEGYNAWLDVYLVDGESGYLLDCQADFLSTPVRTHRAAAPA